MTMMQHYAAFEGKVRLAHEMYASMQLLLHLCTWGIGIILSENSQLYSQVVLQTINFFLDSPLLQSKCTVVTATAACLMHTLAPL